MLYADRIGGRELIRDHAFYDGLRSDAGFPAPVRRLGLPPDP